MLTAYDFGSHHDLLAQLLALYYAAAADPSVATHPGGHDREEAYTSSYRLSAAPL